MDTNILLGAKGIEIPNPLQAAGQGLTLANLYNSNQLGQMNLEMQRQRAAFYGGPDAAAMWNGGGAGGAPGAPDMSSIGKYGLAAPGLVEDFLKMQKQTSDIAESQAKAEQSRTEALTKKLTTLGNYSAKAMENPTPQNIQGYLRQHQMTGAPADFFGPMPPMGSAPEAWQKYLAGVTAVTQDEAQRQTAAKQLVMLPLEAAASKAATAQIQQNMGFKPQEVNIAQQNANTGAFSAQTGRMDLVQPKLTASPAGNVYQDNRFGVPGQAGFGKTGTAPSVTETPGGQTVPVGDILNTVGKAIAGGMVPPPTRASPFAEAQIANVLKQDPTYDATFYPNKQATVTAFGPSGDQGNNVRAIDTAMSHLDVYGQYFSALKNGNIQLANEYKNKLTSAVGLPQTATIAAAQQIVANEVTQAMIKAGAAEGDREKAYSTFTGNQSPAQQASSAGAYQQLFAGKLGELQRQYEVGSKLTDFTKFLSPRVKEMVENPASPAASAKTIDALTPETAKANPGVTVQGKEGTFKSVNGNWTRIGPPGQ